MKNIDGKIHVKGESIYVNDIPLREGTLFAAVFGSPKAHGKIKKIDIEEARKARGVEAVFTAKDIVGVNQIGSIIQDEPLMADGEVHFQGMPVAVVIATSERYARMAVKKVKVEIDELSVIVDPRIAKSENQLLIPPRTFSQGDTDKAFKDCEYVFEGSADMGGQEHTYLETQGSYVYPLENGQIMVHSSTQAPSYVQKGVCKVLGLSQNQVEVDVVRLGGAFGGKEDQGTPWACLAALASYHLKKPVKLILSREDDMIMSGKRHPYAFDFKIGFDKHLKIRSYEIEMFQNAGASSDVSPAVMERSLFHGCGAYFVPNAKITAYSCKTNIPPNTAFRGFGAPQAMFAFEAAIYKAASELGVDPSVIQERNLLKDGDSFHYGQMAERSEGHKTWDKAYKSFKIDKLKEEIGEFNRTNDFFKKGVATFPLCFGISFTKTSLNQGRSLVHIYTDGSVSVSTGVIEMGQGVNTKIRQVAASILSIDKERIRIISTNTTRVANASPTAASSGADLNGGATKIACENLRDRLLSFISKELKCDASSLSLQNGFVYQDGVKTEIDWSKLVIGAYEDRVCLSEQGHYSTPEIHFDKSTEKGHPFAYHVYGTAVTVVKLDCLRGVYEIESMNIVHDYGTSMNSLIDLGQVEGAAVQGIGLMTIEELLYNESGKNVYNSLSSYKIPDIYFIPKELNVISLDTKPASLAIMGSKAVGEPPLMYGISVYFAVMKAVKAFNPNYKCDLSAPATYQKTLLALYSK